MVPSYLIFSNIWKYCKYYFLFPLQYEFWSNFTIILNENVIFSLNVYMNPLLLEIQNNHLNFFFPNANSFYVCLSYYKLASLKEISQEAVLKFEPMIMHIQCDSLAAAQQMVSMMSLFSINLIWMCGGLGEAQISCKFNILKLIIIVSNSTFLYE